MQKRFGRMPIERGMNGQVAESAADDGSQHGIGGDSDHEMRFYAVARRARDGKPRRADDCRSDDDAISRQRKAPDLEVRKHGPSCCLLRSAAARAPQFLVSTVA